MPQLFQVLRCYKCLTFQIHHNKKSNKFSCKICNEKQSIKRNYGSGIAKDCRLHVQRLNKMRAEKDGIKLEGSSDELDTSVNSCEDYSDDTSCSKTKRESKWSTYIDVEADKTVTAESSVEETEECEKYNSRWQNKKKYWKYKSRKRSSASKQYNSDHESDCDNTEDFENKANCSNIAFGKKTFSMKENCVLTSDDNIKLNQNTNKRPKFDALVAKSSKWSHFVEDENIEEHLSNEENENSTENSTMNIQSLNEENKNSTENSIHIQSMFSLYDESDIDDLLNI